jgi:hypothetical protein
MDGAEFTLAFYRHLAESFQPGHLRRLNTMKGLLRSILVASCVAGFSMPLRAQSVQDDAGTITTDTERGDGATRPNKDDFQEPAGEPKGTNVTGADTTSETTVEPSDAEKTRGESSAAKEEPSGSER